MLKIFLSALILTLSICFSSLAVKPERAEQPGPDSMDQWFFDDYVLEHIFYYLSDDPKAICTGSLVSKKWQRHLGGKNQLLKNLRKLWHDLDYVAPLPLLTQNEEGPTLDLTLSQHTLQNAKTFIDRMEKLWEDSELLPHDFRETIELHTVLQNMIVTLGETLLTPCFPGYLSLDVHNFSVIKQMAKFEYIDAETINKLAAHARTFIEDKAVYLDALRDLFFTTATTPAYVQQQIGFMNSFASSNEYDEDFHPENQCLMTYIMATLALKNLSDRKPLADFLLDFAHQGYLRSSLPHLHLAGRVWILAKVALYLDPSEEFIRKADDILDAYEAVPEIDGVHYLIGAYLTILADPNCPLCFVHRVLKIFSLHSGSVRLKNQTPLTLERKQLWKLRSCIQFILANLTRFSLETELQYARDNRLQPYYTESVRRILSQRNREFNANKRKYGFTFQPNKRRNTSCLESD